MKYFRSSQYPIEFVLSENIVGISPTEYPAPIKIL